MISQSSPKSLNVWTVSDKMSEIFLSGTGKGAVWVLLDTNLCQKGVCGKYSMQKSVLKINKCHAFSTRECQGICCIPISNTSLASWETIVFHFASGGLLAGADVFLQTGFFVDDLSSFCVLKE